MGVVKEYFEVAWYIRVLDVSVFHCLPMSSIPNREHRTILESWHVECHEIKF